MGATETTNRRQARERELVQATRRLFDERGMQDAPIEEIAQAVGIARGLIYRQFSSKEELYVLTVTDYLSDLAELLQAAREADTSPTDRLEAGVLAFASFCQRYPAFLDCSTSLTQRPARELHEKISESIWLRLGQGMGDCLEPLIDTLHDGVRTGEFVLEDPAYTANVMWTQTLGIMHLARLRIGLHQVQAGVPGIFLVEPERVIASCVDAALAAARR